MPASGTLPADRHAMRGGDADAQAGEAAGADADQDSAGDMAVEHLLDHRHQPLGMAAADHFVARRDDQLAVGANSAAVQAAVDVSSARINGMSLQSNPGLWRHRRAGGQAKSEVGNQTASMVSTSGT